MQKTVSYDIIPASTEPIYIQRETGITHSSFQAEYILYQAIRLGDSSEVKNAIEAYQKSGLIIGKLSSNHQSQIKYWAIACISVAIHYAILGGLDETDAFNLSDQYIRHIDSLTDLESCFFYLKEKALELTERVSRAKSEQGHSPVIYKCIHYIHIHLHERLTIASIAESLHVSRDYLSSCFHEEMSITLHHYIIRQKLEAAKLLLAKGENYNIISYQLSFCSESHFITCFKRAYGITPGEYRRNIYPESD